jgi:two-component system nitrate/nitrite response regulator NarL
MSMEGNSLGRLRVVIAENTRMAGRLLADALSQDGLFETSATSLMAETMQTIGDVRPAVVLVSEALEEDPKRGFQVVRQIRAAWPEIRVVMLLDGCRPEPVVEAFRAGARGVFSRDESLKDLAACVARVSQGEISAKSEQMRFAIEALASTPSTHEMDAQNLLQLSKREREVVGAVAEGLSNREIGERMGLSPHTVKNYVFRIFEKLGVSSRFELMAALSHQKPALHRSWDAESGSERLDTAESLLSAAEAGVSSAQFVVGHLYLDGELVQKDKVLAYKWLLLAERTNQTFSVASRLARKKLATEMLSWQVAEGERMASEWAGGPEDHSWCKAASAGVGEKAAVTVA